MTDETEAYERPYHQQIDVRYWMKLAVYACLGILLVLGLIIAVALTMMILRYINAKPS